MGAVGVNTAFCWEREWGLSMQSCSDQEETGSAPGDLALTGQMQVGPRETCLGMNRSYALWGGSTWVLHLLLKHGEQQLSPCHPWCHEAQHHPSAPWGWTTSLHFFRGSEGKAAIPSLFLGQTHYMSHYITYHYATFKKESFFVRKGPSVLICI